MTVSPRICFGMGLHNCAEFLPSAMDSILSQTYADFRVIAVDDCSTDDTEEIMRHYVSVDKRVTYLKNEKRQGEIITWRRAFLEAQEGGLDYFAWATDHDFWHPDWLQEHMGILNEYPDVVLAYPLVVAISANDEELFREPRRFETFGMSKMDRVRAACTKMVGAGNMIYGLFRASALAKCGVFPCCATPDRLLLLEMSVHGTYKQIQRYLWYRRYPKGKPSINGVSPDYEQQLARQRVILFPDARAPWHSRFPILGQALGLVYHLSLRPPSGSYTNAHLGPYMAYLNLRRRREFLKREFEVFADSVREKWRTR